MTMQRTLSLGIPGYCYLEEAQIALKPEQALGAADSSGGRAVTEGHQRQYTSSL